MIMPNIRFQPVRAWTDGTITIGRYGSVDPVYAPITRNGDTYTLTEDIANVYNGTAGIIIRKANIVIDGAGHTLQGPAAGMYGIYFDTDNVPENITVKNITVKGFYYGIDLSGARACNVTGSNISAYYHGIHLFSSSNNTIGGNSISANNQTAIALGSDSHNNTIFGNSIANSQYGIWFDYSWDNKIYHNVFRNNSQQAYITPLGIVQSWDDGYPSGGNYWSDYESINPNATEIDHTGLWNTPYVLDPNNRDNYPFMYALYQPVQGPTANFSCSQSAAKVDDVLVFNASSSLPGSNGTYPTPITGYLWDFGDGNVTPTSQPTIEHSYPYGAVFNITLTVTDSQGLNSSCSRTLTVMMPTTLSVTTNSTSTVLGYVVNIYGNLSDAHENGLANELVMLHYTFPGSLTWYPISSASTDTLGQYYIQWLPQATGYFTIKAEWAGNATHVASYSNVTLSVIPYQSTYAFSVESNSTVSGLTFDTASQKLSFSASGENGTTGYVRITIAKALVPDVTKLEVRLDGVEYNYSALSLDDSWLLVFTYNHSIHQIEVCLDPSAVPEFPSFIILPLFMIATLLATIVWRKKRVNQRPL
jgi:parallel beta-helix repeat protein